MHSKFFESGLCEFVAGTGDALEMHLFTYETYDCCVGDVRYNTLAEVKHHVCEDQTKGKTFI